MCFERLVGLCCLLLWYVKRIKGDTYTLGQYRDHDFVNPYPLSCSAARRSLDFIVIRVSTDLEVIQRFTFYAARYCAAEEQDSDFVGGIGNEIY
jgi:hypothetical protein